MHKIRIATAIAAAALAAACASGKSQAPTGYTAMSEKRPEGFYSRQSPEGHTEIFVRLNPTSPRSRARRMAYYHAARLGAEQNAAAFDVLRDQAGMDCLVNKKHGGRVLVLSPFLMVPTMIASAVAKSRDPYFAFPTHYLNVVFRSSDQVSASVSVTETLASHAREFKGVAAAMTVSAGDQNPPPDETDESDPSEAELEQWAQTWRKNADFCTQHFASDHKSIRH